MGSGRHDHRGVSPTASASSDLSRWPPRLFRGGKAQLDPPAVRQRLDQLLAATEGQGPDVTFLERWNYDTAQRQAIAQVVAATQRSLA